MSNACASMPINVRRPVNPAFNRRACLPFGPRDGRDAVDPGPLPQILCSKWFMACVWHANCCLTIGVGHRLWLAWQAPPKDQRPGKTLSGEPDSVSGDEPHPKRVLQRGHARFVRPSLRRPPRLGDPVLAARRSTMLLPDTDRFPAIQQSGSWHSTPLSNRADWRSQPRRLPRFYRFGVSSRPPRMTRSSPLPSGRARSRAQWASTPRASTPWPRRWAAAAARSRTVTSSKPGDRKTSGATSTRRPSQCSLRC